MNERPNNPMHGITLEMILNRLVEQFGWDELGKRIPIRCFTNDPSIKSSLKFLRRTPWARKKVEDLYLETQTRMSNRVVAINGSWRGIGLGLAEAFLQPTAW
jgi:uncharacterized protein (DUF2132 family)